MMEGYQLGFFGNLVIVLIIGLLLIYPLWRIFSRAGLMPALSLLVFIPSPFLGPFVALILLAFNSWPVSEGEGRVAGWKVVSPEEAANNKYYGFKGWIISFYVLIAFGTLMNVVTVLFNPLGGLLADIVGDEAWFGDPVWTARVMGLVGIVLAIPFLLLAPMKHRLMPMVTIVCYWLAAVVGVLFSTAYPLELALQTSFNLIIIAIVFSGYLVTSRRVNVTYYHRVPTN